MKTQFKNYWKKVKEIYKHEDFSKGMIIAVVLLTAIVAVIAIGDSNNMSLAFWLDNNKNVTNLPNTGSDTQLSPKYRACIWQQNTVKSCEPSFIAGLVTNNKIQLADKIEIVPIVDFDLGTGAPVNNEPDAENSWGFDNENDENWGRGAFTATASQWSDQGNNAPGSRIIFDGSRPNPFGDQHVGEVTQTLDEFTVKATDKITMYINAVPKLRTGNITLKMRLGTGTWFTEGVGADEHGAFQSNEDPNLLTNYVEITTSGNEWIKVELLVDAQAVGKTAGPILIKVVGTGTPLEYILIDDVAWNSLPSNTVNLSDDEITAKVNDPSVKWKALLVGVGGVSQFRGLESTGNPNVPGTAAFDYANGGVYGLRPEYTGQLDLAKQFPGPFQVGMTSEVTTADGETTSDDIALTLLVDKLGSHLGALYVDDMEYVRGFNYTDNSPLVGIPAQFISPGYSNRNDIGVRVNIPSETTTDTYFESWVAYLENLLSAGIDKLKLYVLGNCSELNDAGTQYTSKPLTISSLIQEKPEDNLPNKEYLTNVGEVYSYENTEALCDEYLEKKNDPFVVEGMPKDKFFDIAVKPKCNQCEYNPSTYFGGTIICENGGLGRRLADVPELRNSYGSPDPDYEAYYYEKFDDDFACKLDDVIEGTFERDMNADGSYDFLPSDNGKPIPDKELQYWNEETRPGPDGGVRPWCWLKYNKQTSLYKQASVDMTVQGAEIPAAAGSIFHVLRKMTEKLPNGREKQICLNEDIGTIVTSKLGILDTKQCNFFREITGERVTAYYTLEQLIAKTDLPFNQGGTAQMCSPEKRIEPACDGKATPSIGQYGLTQIPESPVQGGGFTYVYYTFPFMGNIPSLEQAYARMLQNIKDNPDASADQQMKYIEDLLPSFNARVCDQGEMNIAVKWLINLGYITEDDAIKLNLYNPNNVGPATN